MRISRAYCPIVCCLMCAIAHGQEVPMSAKVHEKVETIVDGRIVSTNTRDTIFYRSSDGSTLTLPDGGNAEAMGTLWDNRAGTSYRLDFKRRVAHQDPNSPHVPNPPSHPRVDNFPEDNVEGNSCRVVPLTVKATRQYSGFSPTPGKTCVSTELGLELRSDVTVQTAPGRTERHLRELYDVHVNVEPDRNLFDLQSYTIR